MAFAERDDSQTDIPQRRDLAVPPATDAHADAIKCSLIDRLKHAGGQDA